MRGDIVNGTYNGRTLPPSGYVTQVDDTGVAAVTSDVPDPNDMFETYFWSDTEGVFAMMRGGFYSGRSDAGVYSVHAATNPNFTGTAVGFRCVR